MSMEGIIGVIPPIIATVAVVHVLKSFTNPQTGQKEEFSLHGTYDDKAEATTEAKLLRADGDKARVTKSGSKYKVWNIEGGKPSSSGSKDTGSSFW